ADLTGRSTHGVSRLPTYVERIRSGLINPSPQVAWQQTGALSSVDGDNGLGPVAAWQAVELAMDRARVLGVGLSLVKDSNHCGALSAYCDAAARQGFVLLALTNASPAMPPWGGKTPIFGTNPIALGFPRQPTDAPLVIDLATSVVARGHIFEALRRGESIPAHWAIDQAGNPTTDPQAALLGAVLPMGGAKGYALALIVDLLSGVLSGAGYGSLVGSIRPEDGQIGNVGHFFLAINPQMLASAEVMRERLAVLEQEIYAAAATDAQHPVRLPGDRAQKEYAQQKQHGIRLDQPLIAGLQQLAKDVGAPALQVVEEKSG
ncbi:MAG: Ldh family oxidoreductase, partial [Firmicutes bacterium]|nr:Ldh family oxidoreductase [Bacillota bacterium]